MHLQLGIVLAGGIGVVALAHPHLGAATVVSRQTDATYDYIVIGGGTAGLTIADRLTEDPNTSVLVLEYGPLSNSTSITTVSGGVGGMTDPSLQFSITSVPQTNLRNRTSPVSIAKVVGGGSAINAMMTIRGTAEDYDRWASFFPAGKSSWTWKGLLPYFKRAVNFVAPDAGVARAANITYDQSFWGNTSGVYASWPTFQYPATTVLMDAFRGMEGVQFPGDSGAGRTGVFWYPQFADPKTVTRSYARTGHYDGKNRANYQLLPGSKVTRILFEGTRAVGVAYQAVPAGRNVPAGNGTVQEIIVRAKKEVILSAGAIHSPQILQLSGIGPKKALDAANITTLVELPGVGQNFQDHNVLSAAFSFRNLTLHPSTEDLFNNITFLTWAATLWSANKTGPYSLATGNAAAWLPFPVISPRHAELASLLTAQNHTASLPDDVHPTVAAGYAAQMSSLASAMQNNNTAFYNLVMSGGTSSGMLIDLHPLSRGTVTLDLRDPAGREPRVDYRVLSNPLDRLVMAEILRYTRRYHFDNPLTKNWGAVEYTPGSDVNTDEEFAAYLVDAVSPSYYHPVGTCAMMPRELGGVVDEELRVYGTAGLRVVDASVIPTIPGANTCQTVYAIGEKAADLIRSG
ncbi:hypothetical protein QBC47DRAFT_438262 [Echria macrotheca]|uniref:Glucose-methanol-choline oxidoreductase N-terminal domain-containing protein n=1 Tax=Echria macrotheca TaxID=438768 RepID=A0AAJ0F985_9PEZI|nr:hypothetical protein QBC47DRAFT_438262 [Echria macrotheca]